MNDNYIAQLLEKADEILKNASDDWRLETPSKIVIIRKGDDRQVINVDNKLSNGNLKLISEARKLVTDLVAAIRHLQK